MGDCLFKGIAHYLYETANVICVYWRVDKAAYLPHPPPQLFYQSYNPTELAATLLSTEAAILW